jgi:anthranilate phosphoribosyltransferase
LVSNPLTSWSDEALLAFLQGQLSPEATEAALLHLLPEAVPPALFVRLWQLLRRLALPLAGFPLPFPVLDVCGTGGSGRHGRFNTSTASAFALQALRKEGLALPPLLKFGNKGVSGSGGSFDLLESMGVPVEQSPQQVAHTLATQGLAFLFAPAVYPALGALQPFRKALGAKTGQPTVLNALGPLLNPALPAFRLHGYSHPAFLEGMLAVLQQQPSLQQAVLVRSASGLDEWDPLETATLHWVNAKGEVREETRSAAAAQALVGVTPQQVALWPQQATALAQLSADQRLAHTQAVLANGLTDELVGHYSTALVRLNTHLALEVCGLAALP